MSRRISKERWVCSRGINIGCKSILTGAIALGAADDLPAVQDDKIYR
jgi:hypothetical protein